MYHLQLLMVALIIIGVTLGGAKKLRKFAQYSLLLGCVLGIILFSIFNMYIVVLLAVYGAGITVNRMHTTTH